MSLIGTFVSNNEQCDKGHWSGTWHSKVSLERGSSKPPKPEMAYTGKVIDMFGPEPQGWLLITNSGRMAALITTSDRNEVDRSRAGPRGEGHRTRRPSVPRI
jgi:Lipocalin-like domain